MARVVARAARSSRLLVVVAALVVAAGVLAGCSRGPRPPWRAPELRAAHAYTAVLMAEHPLYDALADLETALADLGDGEWSPVLPPLDMRFAPILMAQSLTVGDPAGRLTTLRQHWRGLYPPLQLPGDALTQDLHARVAWVRRQAYGEVARQKAQAEAEQSRRLARLRAELVQRYQERLTNLRIDETLGDQRAAERAVAERERVWQAIEAELEAERLRLAEAARRSAEAAAREAAGRIAAVQEQADSLAGARATAMEAAGAGLYDEMIAAISAPWPEPAVGEVEVRVEADAANRRMELAEGSRQVAEAARREIAEQQRLETLRALGRLRGQLKSETEMAARVVAHREGLDLRLLPGRPSHGVDVTSSMARKLATFWGEAGRRRS